MKDNKKTDAGIDIKSWQIALQLVKEFGIPTVLTIGWVLWDGKGETNYDYVGKFSLLIMSMSYLFLQWHRVKKQLRTDQGLTELEKGVAKMLQDMEKATKDIVGYATGGDSVCWLEPGKAHSLTGEFIIHHKGKYPLRDVHMRVVDLGRFGDPEQQINALTENMFTLNLIIPGHVRMISLNSSIQKPRDAAGHAFNIFITTPKGSYTQLLRIVRIEGVLKSAVLLETDAETIMEKVDDGFPRKDDGTVDWDVHSVRKSGQGAGAVMRQQFSSQVSCRDQIVTDTYKDPQPRSVLQNIAIVSSKRVEAFRGRGTIHKQELPTDVLKPALLREVFLSTVGN